MPVEKVEIQLEMDNTQVQKTLIQTKKTIFEWIKEIESKGKIVFDIDIKTGKIKNFEEVMSRTVKNTKKVFEKEKLEPVMSLQEYQEQLKKVEIYARDTKKKLSPDMKFDLQLNVVNAEKKVEELKEKIKQYKKEGEVPVVLQMQVKEAKNNLTEANRELRNFINTGDTGLSRLGLLFDSVGNGFSSIMKGAGIFSAVAGSATVAYNALDNFALAFQSQESAFAGVQKTVNATDEEFRQMNDGLKDLAKQMPITYEELASIAEVGGQMGIAKEYLLDFTETVGKLGTAISGVSKEEAAQTLVRIVEATGQGVGHVDELADALVSLGNNFKANEGQILDFSNRIFGAGALVGMTGEQIMAIGTAFTDVGLTAEAGGSSVSKAILTINQAVVDGGVQLSQFAQIAGMSAEEFKTMWQEDSATAFSEFIEGLGEAGDGATTMIQELLANSSEMQRAFLSMAGNSDVLKNALDNVANSAGSLEEEFTKRLQTTDSQLQINANKWAIWKGNIGENLAGAKLALSNFVLNMVTGLSGGVQIVGKVFQLLYEIVTHTIAFMIQKAVGSFNYYTTYIKEWGAWLATNIGTIVENMGTLFQNIPYYLGKALQDAINKAKDWVNTFGGWMNKISNFLGLGDIVGEIGDANFMVGSEAKAYKSLTTFTPSAAMEVDKFNKSVENEIKVGLGNKILDIKQDIVEIVEKNDMNSVKNRTKAENQEKQRLKKQMDEETARLVEELKNPKSGKGGGSGKGSGGKGKKEEYSEEIKAIKDRYKAELNEIDKMNITEEEKAKRKKEVFEKLEKEIANLKKDNFEKEKANIEEITKRNEEQNSKKIENIKKSLDSELKAIESSSASDIEKNYLKRKAYEKMQREIDEMKEKSHLLTEKQLEDLDKLQEEVHEAEVKRWKDADSIADKYYEDLIKQAEKYADELDKIQKKQDDVRNNMDKLLDNTKDSLADRYIKLEDDLEKVGEQKNELIQKASFDNRTMVDFAKSDFGFSSEDNLKKNKKNMVFGNLTGDELLKLKEYIKKEEKLLAERDKLKNGTSKFTKNSESFKVSEEDIKKAKERSEMDETDKLLAKYEEKQAQYEKELEDLTKQEQEKQALYDETIKIKEGMEKNFTDFIKGQTSERISEMEKMKQRAIEIAEQMASLGFNGQGFKASFIKQNADGTTSTKTATINYQNTINQTFNSSGTVTPKEQERATMNALDKSKKGISNLTTKK